MHIADIHALKIGIARMARKTEPVLKSRELFEIARPYLTAIPTWGAYIKDDTPERRAADVALMMLVNLTGSEHWRLWLAVHGDNPGSAAARDAKLRDTRYLTSVTMCDYVRVMAHWDRGGVWEYALACTMADPIQTPTPEQVSRCERITGSSPRQLWRDFHAAWAVRPSLRQW